LTHLRIGRETDVSLGRPPVRRRKRREDSLAVFLRDFKEKWKGGSWWGGEEMVTARGP
jgi:hypothetical protein